MFNEAETKTLTVVYKDELVLNYLRKLIETNDDDKEHGRIVGTEDGTVKVVAWKPRVWESNKKAGNLDLHLLFLGDIKGTDAIIPLMDIKYDKWGIKYGWAGHQAVITVDPSVISRKEYQLFLADFKDRTVIAEKKSPGKGIYFLKKVAITVAFGLSGLSASFLADHFSDRKKKTQQLLLFGVSEMYLNHLDTFLKG